jgi:hypothetical protein
MHVHMCTFVCSLCMFYISYVLHYVCFTLCMFYIMYVLHYVCLHYVCFTLCMFYIMYVYIMYVLHYVCFTLCMFYIMYVLHYVCALCMYVMYVHYVHGVFIRTFDDLICIQPLRRRRHIFIALNRGKKCGRELKQGSGVHFIKHFLP